MRTGLRCLLVALACAFLLPVSFAAEPGSLTIDVGRPGAKIDPMFYGLMTEEINHAYDGGLYAELIQNRIFQDNRDRPIAWSVVGGDEAGKISIDDKNPVNAGALTRSLRLDANNANAGVANSGFWGIPVWPKTKYHASFYARSGEGFTGPLQVSIESNDGKTTFASGKVDSVGNTWKKYDLDLTTADVPTSTSNRFVIRAGSKGTVWFSLVSLFPPTYKNRANGNRIDLMQKLADLKPAYLRFPGGNYLEGDEINERFNWRETIGPLENRPGHRCPWGYRSSDGLGLLEFLYWCEDLNMEPLLAVYAGYSLRQRHVNPGKDLEPFVHEALEEIEYVTGDAKTTKWGAQRAKDGHPEPFKLRYVEIGNEDWFDQSRSYDARFAQFFDAIKAKYPNLQCISTMRVDSRRPDLIDDHDYPSPRQMLGRVHRYRDYSRSAPKIFFGEWATQDGRPTPTMRAALADAAWLTGLQQEADVVLMNCYAPLFVNVNPRAFQWNTNLIGYDAANSFGSPSYYAQMMFAQGGWGDTVLPVEVVSQKVEQAPAPMPQGGIGVGTWLTKAEFKDLSVTQGDKTLMKADFSKLPTEWKTGGNGAWSTKDGMLQQTDERRETWITAGDPSWQDYTLNVKARKTGGGEGFLILVHARDERNYLWFNVGGWGNSRTAIEQAIDGAKTELGSPSPSPFTVETGKWYDVRVEVRGRDVKCYIDDKLIAQGTDNPAEATDPLFAAASRVDSTGDVILKVVNTAAMPQQIRVNLSGVDRVGKDSTVETMTGQPNDVNGVEQPMKVAPKQTTINNAGTSFNYEFPAYSVNVIRLKTK